jgi:hypothetical protein
MSGPATPLQRLPSLIHTPGSKRARTSERLAHGVTVAAGEEPWKCRGGEGDLRLAQARQRPDR